MADEVSPEEIDLETEETSVKDESLENSTLSGNDEDNEDAGSDGDAGDPGEQHEFEIIDQVESEDETGDGGDSKAGSNRNVKSEGGGEGDDSSDTDDFDDTELHALLEKGIDKDSITNNQNNEQPTDGSPIIRHKTVLRELDSDPFDILPEGWVCATHNSGMPVYLHKKSRVCTMAKPYYLGNASTRRHDIPISAIPCLQYRKQLKKIENENEGNIADTKATENTDPKDINGETVSTFDESTDVKVNSDLVQDKIEECSSPQQQKICPISSEKLCKHKTQIWMVSQESSQKDSPACNSIEAIHTGKEDFKDILSSADNLMGDKSEISLHADSTNTSTAPKSPEGENIAVTFESSTLLNTDDGTNGVSVLNSQENKDTNVQDSDTVSFSEETNVKVFPEDSPNPVENNHFHSEKPDCKFLSQSIQPSPHNCPIDIKPSEIDQKISEESVAHVKTNDSLFSEESSSPSKKNDSIVSEEASMNSEPSEIVTSKSNNIIQIKRKIDDIKNRHGGKFRKLESGSSSPSLLSGAQPDNNIAVNSTGVTNGGIALGTTVEKLKAHAAGVKIKTAEERAKESVLDVDAVHKYCTQLFQFKTIVVKKYRTWKERRKHLAERNRSNLPDLPSSTKLITCPIIRDNLPNGSTGMGRKKEFVLNPSGKSFLGILHEYMQRTVKIQPTYVFKELENSRTPYGATVLINKIEYGTGYASSKKMAKQEAAKETLRILIPDLSTKVTDEELKHNISDLSFFDEIKVEDHRVHELGNKVGQPSPFQILRECLRRYFGMGNPNCDMKTTALNNQKCEFVMKVGKHTATVIAKNKRDGKQLASQAILAKLHPHVPSWGSLLRLYATNVEKPVEKVEEMNEIKTHAPNKAVLESLREEMKKLHHQKEAIQSKGTMVVSSRDLPIKMSGVDL